MGRFFFSKPASLRLETRVIAARNPRHCGLKPASLRLETRVIAASEPQSHKAEDGGWKRRDGSGLLKNVILRERSDRRI